MKIKKLIAPVLSLSLLIPSMAQAAVPMPSPTPTVNTPAIELRASLDRLLSEHFALAVSAMRTAYDGSKDAAAAYNALDQNALDMQPAIESLYGKEGAAEFERIFRAHNKYTDDLVKATKAGDMTARKKAEQQVENFVEEFSTFLGKATAGKLPQQTAEQVLRLHEDQVQEVFDDYVAGDYTGAYQAYREGFNEMFTVSKALSTAITAQLPEKFNNTKPDTKAADLRSALNRLAAEHFALSVLEMQKQYDNAKDYNALIQAEAANTADFKAAISSIYGQAGADQFEKIWTENHVNAQADYVKAVQNNDQNARQAVQKRISQFTMDFAAFLDAATAQKLPKDAALAALTQHENQVQQVLDQYAAGSYTNAYQTNRAGYELMFGVGQALGNGIVSQMPDKFMDTAAPAPSVMTVWMKVNSKQLNIDSKTTMMDTTPFIWNNMTYIPLRFLSEGIGADVKWDQKAQQVTVMAGKDTLKFWIGKDFMEVNGTKKQVGAKVFVNKDGRTVVPLRFITELLGWNVKWTQQDGSITLTKAM
ncbi:copper amine oxidase N-terminal domain-containing protein [Paenibacillus sp. JX-17]|uniref:Copper amine oxidase N-terminal domain-containing protein n=1 Tax=Paenibacillus lacisoli TaxID=3064525 RepID=A0ABT9CAQ4_9BACL|nr:copper amine oxidase N-terminal domain-containing protein [Paenibacillus sp. JX-17]MDO7906345.1 copper amine oxidase N-terminal domain-containing protein [Paenibacillus sp. JX-17]